MPTHLESRPGFIGRVDELSKLWAAYESARSGRGNLVLLAGPLGIGKSRLAADFTNEVTNAGGRVLIGRSWEAGGHPPTGHGSRQSEDIFALPIERRWKGS